MTAPDPRTKSAIKVYGFDPRHIGTNHIDWWINDRDGTLCVLARDYSFIQEEGKPTAKTDIEATGRVNYKDQYRSKNIHDPKITYVFIPLDQVEPEQEE